MRRESPIAFAFVLITHTPTGSKKQQKQQTHFRFLMPGGAPPCLTATCCSAFRLVSRFRPGRQCAPRGPHGLPLRDEKWELGSRRRTPVGISWHGLIVSQLRSPGQRRATVHAFESARVFMPMARVAKTRGATEAQPERAVWRLSRHIQEQATRSASRGVRRRWQ